MNYLAFVLGYDILHKQLNYYGIPCDFAYDYCCGIINGFRNSPENKQDKSEYECLWDYVNNHIHEIELQIIGLA